MQGKLICIYGINNIGKSTQVKLLVEKLKSQGRDVEYVKYPIYDLEPSGPFINKVLRDPSAPKISEEELQMWYTLNRFQFQPKLKAMLGRGAIVVAEDYIGTGLAWGGAKGANARWLEKVNEPLIQENLAILLDGERFTQGKEAGHLHESNDALIEVCRIVHQELAIKFGWKTVHANQSTEAVAGDIWSVVELFLQN